MEISNIKNFTILLSLLHKLFDVARIIDPIEKQVISYKPKNGVASGSVYYDLWESGMLCENCAVQKAFLENHTFTKIEYRKNKSFIITATPVELEGKRYIVEMLRDITNTGIITDVVGPSKIDNSEIIAELHKKVITDDLTGLYNRRYINEKLPIEISEATINETTFSIIMLDIDCFKNVNDTYGHHAGDIVIQNVGRIMTMCVRNDTDWVARYGGEEFLIFLRGADKEAAYKVAENIRMTLEKEVVNYDDDHITVTISSGTYTVNAGMTDVDKVIKLVDKNLSQAKKGGRNRTVSS